MNKDISPELIKKYLAGNCTEAEKKFVDEWYESFAGAPDFTSELSPSEQSQLKNSLLNRIKNNIHQVEVTEEANAAANIIQMPPPAKNTSLVYYVTRVAAIILLVCGAALLGQKYWAPKEPAAKIIAQTIFKNQSEQIKKVVLSDGSQVWLQDNSRLAIADDFGKATRNVILTGEAFFDVAKDRTRPFIIYSQGVTTRVVGTSFNIKAYEKDATVEVSVVSGKVSVLSPDRLPATTGTAAHKPGGGMRVLLTPNQKVTYLKNGQHLVKKEVAEPGRRMVWAKTSLSFKDTPIRQVIKKLNDHFATNIKLANEDINNCSIQGDFTNQNLLEILDIVCNSIEAEYKLYKNEIIISGEGCPLVKN